MCVWGRGGGGRAGEKRLTHRQLDNTQQFNLSIAYKLPLLLEMTSLMYILEIIKGMKENLFSFVRFYFHNNNIPLTQEDPLKFHILP